MKKDTILSYRENSSFHCGAFSTVVQKESLWPFILSYLLKTHPCSRESETMKPHALFVLLSTTATCFVVVESFTLNGNHRCGANPIGDGLWRSSSSSSYYDGTVALARNVTPFPLSICCFSHKHTCAFVSFPFSTIQHPTRNLLFFGRWYVGRTRKTKTKIHECIL